MNKYDPGQHVIDIDSIINLRDLGGMPISGGRSFPDGIIFRSGTLAEATDEAMASLKQLGIRTVIDLRSESEVRRYGNKAQNNPDFDFHNISLFLGDPDLGSDPTMNFLRTHLLGDFYVDILETLGGNIAKVLDIIAGSEGGVLYHCAHGKDRTGIISAILYLIAGADREDIIRNYEYSYEYIKWFLDPLIEKREDCLKHTLRSDRVNMEIMLRHIDDNYGGDILNYLDHIGVRTETLDLIRSKVFS
ncbi:MAG: tyrosine-protein phosphatase [Clostridiales bacterium]|nr:tyrosine-protein phosphatase [Clostridiales bacterium]